MGYRLNRLDEPIFMAVSKPMLTDVIIDWRVVWRDIVTGCSKTQPVRDFLARHFVSSLGRTDKIFLYLFLFSSGGRLHKRDLEELHDILINHPEVEWVEKQDVLSRTKRAPVDCYIRCEHFMIFVIFLYFSPKIF